MKLLTNFFLLSFVSLMDQLYIQYLTSALDKKKKIAGDKKNMKKRPNSPNLTVAQNLSKFYL